MISPYYHGYAAVVVHDHPRMPPTIHATGSERTIAYDCSVLVGVDDADWCAMHNLEQQLRDGVVFEDRCGDYSWYWGKLTVEDVEELVAEGVFEI